MVHPSVVQLDTLLSALPDGEHVAVISTLGSMCPITLGHVQMFIESRALLRDDPHRLESLIPRPPSLRKYKECIGIISLNSERHVSNKLAQKGLVAPTLHDREEMVDLATAEYDWLLAGRHLGIHGERNADIILRKRYPNLRFKTFVQNGADDVIKYRKWNFPSPPQQLALGRAGRSAEMLQRARADGCDLTNAKGLLVGPELPDISSTDFRKALVDRDEIKMDGLVHPAVREWHRRHPDFLYGQQNTVPHPLLSNPQFHCRVKRSDTINATLLRSEKITDQRAFIPHSAVHNGETIKVIQIEPCFARVRVILLGEKVDGYIQTKHLSGDSMIVQRPDDIQQTTLRTEMTTEQRAWVPKSAIKNGTKAEVLYMDAAWAYVRSPAGKEGFIQRKHIHPCVC